MFSKEWFSWRGELEHNLVRVSHRLFFLISPFDHRLHFSVNLPFPFFLKSSPLSPKTSVSSPPYSLPPCTLPVPYPPSTKSHARTISYYCWHPLLSISSTLSSTWANTRLSYYLDEALTVPEVQICSRLLKSCWMRDWGSRDVLVCGDCASGRYCCGRGWVWWSE